MMPEHDSSLKCTLQTRQERWQKSSLSALGHVKGRWSHAVDPMVSMVSAWSCGALRVDGVSGGCAPREPGPYEHRRSQEATSLQANESESRA